MGEHLTEDLTETITDESFVTMKDYLASLRYAGMIQKSMLPLPALMTSLLKEYFVSFMPRDYVSGDFYYVFRGRDYYCVAAGDCTGHGVPGSLLSIMGVSFLNEILQCQPAPRANRVLNLMREKVMSALHQTGVTGEQMDSIDMSLCIFTPGSYEMQFSGANRPLFIVNNGHLREIRADKMPIGSAPLVEEPFNNKIVTFDDNDMFYLFSDGFPDQFGGPLNKKFKYRQFRALLSEISIYKAARQKRVIELTFADWKGNNRQVDDVTVFGFKPKIII
jgi:serine phosphatase RsbU (regulator of sigma subunit)